MRQAEERCWHARLRMNLEQILFTSEPDESNLLLECALPVLSPDLLHTAARGMRSPVVVAGKVSNPVKLGPKTPGS